MYYYLSEFKYIFRFIMKRLKNYHRKTISEMFIILVLFLFGNVVLFQFSNIFSLNLFIGLTIFLTGFCYSAYNKFRDDYLDDHAPK